MRLDPLLTSSPVTDAVRYVTDNLLREVYLAPLPVEFSLENALVNRPAPWSASLESAPEETKRAIEAALVGLMRATRTLDPKELNADALPASRAKAHLTALRNLWRDMGDVLPAELSVTRHVLCSSARDALEPLPLLDAAPCPHADPVEQALTDALLAHHGTAPETSLVRWQKRHSSRTGTARGALGHVQASLTCSVDPVEPDGSLTVYGLRDPLEEVEFAAACVQRMMDAGEVDAPSEVGLLVPEVGGYHLALPAAFDLLGLPLSGLPAEPARRDAAGEFLTAVLAVLEGPAPRTALASIFTSQLMPWPQETGRLMARETIDRGWSRAAEKLDGPGRSILDCLRPVGSATQLAARLFAIAEALPDATEVMPRIGEIKAVLGDEIDWQKIRKLVTPRGVESSGPDRFVEGASLLEENALPWRPVRQLIVLGLAGRQWPRPLGGNPFFTESELALIRDHSGLALRDRRQRLARGLELFRRQLCSATDAVTLLVPARDIAGNRLPASTGLALITHLLGANDPAKLQRDIRAEQPTSWPVSFTQLAPLAESGSPQLPAGGCLRLGTDLLHLRKDDVGGAAPQSPSRLETLIVSPLSWLMDEIGAKDRTWAPESLDVLTLGTLIHEVLEVLFPEGSEVPDPGTLEPQVRGALATAIRTHALWLEAPAWATERASLLREAHTTSLAWRRFLHAAGADVLKNEVDLAGDHGGLLIRGRADCILKLPDGRLLLVDHKRSRSGGRRDRMVRGWDLQVALYHAMLQRPTLETELTGLVAAGAQTVTAYHTTLDATVLLDAGGAGVAGAEVVDADVSANAMDHLAQVVAQVGAGVVVLNRAGDISTFKKERAITAYALQNNELVEAFLMPDPAEEPDD